MVVGVLHADVELRSVLVGRLLLSQSLGVREVASFELLLHRASSVVASSNRPTRLESLPRSEVRALTQVRSLKICMEVLFGFYSAGIGG